MQVQKENIRRAILTIAKKEFLAKGFKNTSMRFIAKEAGIGLSNIYNYFKSKDEIHKEVLTPLLKVIEEMLDIHNNSEYLSLEVMLSKEYQMQNINSMVHLVEDFKDELRLLLFHSYGSSLQDFREEFVYKHSKVGVEYLAKMKKLHPQINTEVSPFFIHTLSSWILSIIGEIVLQDGLTHEEIGAFIADYVIFSTAGWKRIMNV